MLSCLTGWCQGDVSSIINHLISTGLASTCLSLAVFSVFIGWGSASCRIAWEYLSGLYLYLSGHWQCCWVGLYNPAFVLWKLCTDIREQRESSRSPPCRCPVLLSLLLKAVLPSFSKVAVLLSCFHHLSPETFSREISFLLNLPLYLGTTISLNIFLSKKVFTGNSLAVWWLGLHASNAGGTCSIPGQRTKNPACHAVCPTPNYFAFTFEE